jgi:ABC-2 type transport system permease protein
VRGTELVVGKLAPYFVVGIVDVAIAVAMGQFLFGVPLRGNAAFLFLASGVFLAGGLSMGMLVSIATRNQLLSYQLAMVLTFLPAFILSGFVFPIENMPMIIRGATHLVPAKYFIVLVRAIYMKGLGPVELALETALLSLFAVAVFAMATLGFRKKLS